jgi:hypothetical protein
MVFISRGLIARNGAVDLLVTVRVQFSLTGVILVAASVQLIAQLDERVLLSSFFKLAFLAIVAGVVGASVVAKTIT